MDLSSIYRNPVVDSDIYLMVRVMRVETQNVGQERPIIYVQMRVPGLQPQFSGRHLHAILHPTAEVPFQKFCDCFGMVNDRYLEAQGRWVAIRLVPDEYKGKKFSTVQFVHQTAQSQWKARKLLHAECAGDMPDWDAGDAGD